MQNELKRLSDDSYYIVKLTGIHFCCALLRSTHGMGTVGIRIKANAFYPVF